MSPSQAKLVSAFLFAGSLVACASTPRAGSASLTAADAPRPESSEASEPAAAAAAPEARESTPPRPDGELACRAKTAEGTTELYLQWKGAEAKGVLRTIAPSGAMTELHVNAQRYKQSIIADDVNASDLVAHAATVVDDHGKKRMRSGDDEPHWADCE